MVDIVKPESMAKGRDIPIRLRLGNDCLMVVKQKCLDTRRYARTGRIRGSDNQLRGG
jgi:hypothetical protein